MSLKLVPGLRARAQARFNNGLTQKKLGLLFSSIRTKLERLRQRHLHRVGGFRLRAERPRRRRQHQQRQRLSRQLRVQHFRLGYDQGESLIQLNCECGLVFSI